MQYMCIAFYRVGRKPQQESSLENAAVWTLTYTSRLSNTRVKENSVKAMDRNDKIF